MSNYEEIDLSFLDADPVGRCGRCHRATWDVEEIGTEDRMPQPDSYPCGGTFVVESEVR